MRIPNKEWKRTAPAAPATVIWTKFKSHCTAWCEKVKSRMKLSRETCLLCEQSFLLGVENIVFICFLPAVVKKVRVKNEC